MSIMNAWISQERAMVCVDTFAAKIGGGAFMASKMAPLVYANLLLAGRGRLDLLANVWSQILNSGVDIHFDRLEGDLPKMIPSVMEALSNVALRDGLEQEGEFFGQSNILLAGWSEQRRSMAAIGFVASGVGNNAIEIVEAKPWLFAPTVPALRGAVFQPNDDGFRAIAEAQVRHYVSQPSVAIGGQLLMAEMTRTQMNIRSLGSL